MTCRLHQDDVVNALLSHLAERVGERFLAYLTVHDSGGVCLLPIGNGLTVGIAVHGDAVMLDLTSDYPELGVQDRPLVDRCFETCHPDFFEQLG